MRHLGRFGIMLLVLFSAALARPEDSSLPVVLANNNRTPAGQLKNGVLELQLDLRRGRWYPEDEGAGYRDVYAFAEAGHAPQSSGPLIRVPQGTEIHATIHNMLPLMARIYGLHRHPGDASDALKLEPGETRELRFLAGEPGTYLYWATTSDKTLELRTGAETMLSGAFVVDPRGAKLDDRIFVLGIWTKEPAAGFGEQIASINGKSWPYAERLTLKLGETIHWRVINPTENDHAMHLHGFYFTVDGEGDGERYESYPQEQRRRAVTEHIDSGHVFEMTWTPERAGNWLFHCHMLVHMSPSKALHPRDSEITSYSSSTPHDHSMGMGGLVLGITVLPGSTPTPSPTAATTHKLQLVISDNPEKIPLYKLEVNDPMRPVPAGKTESPTLLGPPIVLTRGEATEIEVKNQSSNPTVIHWHGVEVESYYDGVPDWTGSGQQTTPPVAPGTSFVAHMTPPRAGTFIYHTHWHDDAQLLNGLYGPLIVLEPGQKYDPEHDRTFVFGASRYPPFGYLLLVNGHPEPDPVELHTSTRYRLRLINITDNAADLRVRLVNKGVPVQWTVIAKDGADLPSAQLRPAAADMGITVGETYDVEYQADTPGISDLEIRQPSFPTPVTLPLKFVETN
jgi:manganese oxidase